MELRDYLEQDIDDFLDLKLSSETSQHDLKMMVRDDQAAAGLITKDYEKELFAALKEHNISKAKEVLHEVKDEFYEYPEGSPERRQLKALLHSLYDKFKEYLEEETAMDQLENSIDLFEKKTLSKSSNSNIKSTVSTPATIHAPVSKPVSKPVSTLATIHAPVSKSVSKPALTPVSKPVSNPVSTLATIHAPVSKPTKLIPKKINILSETDQKSFSTKLNDYYKRKDFDEIINELKYVLEKNGLFELKTAYATAKQEFSKLSIDEQKHYHSQMLDLHNQISKLLIKSSKEKTHNDQNDNIIKKNNIINKIDIHNSKIQNNVQNNNVQNNNVQNNNVQNNNVQNNNVQNNDVQNSDVQNNNKINSQDKEINDKEFLIKKLISTNNFKKASQEYHLLRELLNKLPIEKQHKYYQEAWNLYNKLSNKLVKHQVNQKLLDSYEKKLAENKP